jgi:hypothetical protein
MFSKIVLTLALQSFNVQLVGGIMKKGEVGPPFIAARNHMGEGKVLQTKQVQVADSVIALLRPAIPDA